MIYIYLHIIVYRAIILCVNDKVLPVNLIVLLYKRRISIKLYEYDKHFTYMMCKYNIKYPESFSISIYIYMYNIPSYLCCTVLYHFIYTYMLYKRGIIYCIRKYNTIYRENFSILDVR